MHMYAIYFTCEQAHRWCLNTTVRIHSCPAVGKERLCSVTGFVTHTTHNYIYILHSCTHNVPIWHPHTAHTVHTTMQHTTRTHTTHSCTCTYTSQSLSDTTLRIHMLPCSWKRKALKTSQVLLLPHIQHIHTYIRTTPTHVASTQHTHTTHTNYTCTAPQELLLEAMVIHASAARCLAIPVTFASAASPLVTNPSPSECPHTGTCPTG